ncbi:NUDIX hydrolase [Sphingomonas sp. ID0503]|uniref:NUDIX hydrolase n=1 Tax=Sphingomonas sp. ID0503 TaxID=3399691 RepID=UPI003AFB5B3A
MAEQVEPIPAGTLIVTRSQAGAAPEILLLERSTALVFAAGALVFPGGRVDVGDRVIGAEIAPALEPDDSAARVAAIREAIEEAGVPVGMDPLPDAATISAMRAELADGVPFARLLNTYGLSLDLDRLAPYARWMPRWGHRRFDTRFYVAEIEGDGGATADGGEITRAMWMTAEAALDGAAAKQHRLVFPTLCNLQRLAQHVAPAILPDLGSTDSLAIMSPWIEERGGEKWICIPEGSGYPQTAHLLSDIWNG